jgi:hypothetical protein
MSLKVKGRFKKLATVISILLFAVVLFLNIQISTSETNASGNISVDGIKVSLFQPASAEISISDIPRLCNEVLCYTNGSYICYMIVDFDIPAVYFCYHS